MYMCMYVCMCVCASVRVCVRFLNKYTHRNGVTHMLDVSNHFVRLRLILTHLKWGMGPSFDINCNPRYKVIFGHHNNGNLLKYCRKYTFVRLNDLCMLYKFLVVVERSRILLGS